MLRSMLQTSLIRMTFTAQDQTMFAMSTGPACLSLRRRKTFGLNESREVFRDFEEIGGFDDVPIGFLTIAKKLIWKYQRVLTKKASVKAILCDRGYSAGKVPRKLKPHIIRQECNQYTYNWFLVEYLTLPRRSTESIMRHHNTLLRKKSAREAMMPGNRPGGWTGMDRWSRKPFFAFY